MPAALLFPLAFLGLFEAPLTAAAVAGGAVSIPIIIHLLNRRRFRVVTWAAMRFLLAAQRKNARKMRLEQLILLGVRCLMVLLLVLAMASVTPWAEAVWHWFAPNAVASSTGSRRAHKVLVLDGSFSMGTKAGDSTCFDRARALAARVVREGSGRDGFSVVLMAAPPRRVVPEPSEDARKVEAEVNALRLPHGNADLAATLNTVESLLRASPGKFYDKEVYFLTDMQQSTWIAREPAALSGVLQKIKDKARTIFLDVGQDGVNNLAVTGLELGEPMAIAGRDTPVVATLHNFGDTRPEVSVRLFVGRARSKGGEEECRPHEVQEKVVGVKRGEQATVSFNYKFPTPGDYLLQVQVAHDALELDDIRSAVVTVKDEVPVLLVNGKPATEFYDRATGWLKTALNPLDEKSVPARPRVLSDSDFADEERGALEPYDCVFLCDVPRFSPAEVRRLERHVRRGGSVVIAPGDRVDLGAYNDLLYRAGHGLLPAGLEGRKRPDPGFSFQLALPPGADREDPLKPFRDPAARARLLEPRFQDFIGTRPAARAGPRTVLSFVPVPVPGRKDATARPKATGGPAVLEWQPPAGREPGAGRLRGRVVLVTTTLNGDWNNWPPSPSYLPFVQELLNFAVAPRLREQAVQVGDPLELFLPGTVPGKDAEVQTPDGRKETVQTESQDEATLLRWTDTSVSGTYVAAVGNDPRQYLFAVNVPAVNDSQQSESNLARTSRDELQQVYKEWEVQVVTDPGQVVRTAIGGGGPEAAPPAVLGPEVAHWLLAALLVLVLAEVVLAWQFGHYSAAAADEADRPRSRGRWGWVLFVLPWLLFTVVLGIGFVLAHDAWTGDFLGFLPDGMRRGIERGLDIPPPAVGEGSRWRLEYLPFLHDARSDPWLAGGLAVAGAALVYLIYRREGSARLRGARLLLVGLRVCLLLLLLVVLLPQLKLFFERQGWPDVVLLIDDSQSMATVDRYREPAVKEAADRLAGLADLPEVDRLRLAQALLTRSQPDWLTALLDKRQVRLHVYHCSGRAHRLGDVSSAADVRAALAEIGKLRADNDSSQLGVAVRQVLNDFRGSSLAAVVMLTDGITTEGEDLVKVSKYAAQMGVPLYFVGVGDAQEVRDVYLHDFQSPESVYVNDRVVFEVQLTAQGYNGLTLNGLTLPVVLREKGAKQDIESKTVQVDPGARTVKVRFVHQPKEPGEKVYEVEVPTRDDEVDKENNRLERRLWVRAARRTKVLYVEGYRRYEYHYIKTLLEREDSRIKGNKSIDLNVLLLSADPEFAEEDRSAISEWPTKKVLEGYDVVILGDVDPRPENDPKMTEHLKDLADFVREHGGGLLMIAGERYAPQAYRDSPLKDVLPIDILSAGQNAARGEGPIDESYRPELTPIGRMHPIFKFSSDEKENDAIWGQLKEMYWYADGYQPKRAAEVLAVHPRVRRADKEGTAGDGKDGLLDRHPLVLQQFVGAGRSMFFGFDETWRWGFRDNQARFNDFWIQAVRYLARDRLGRIDLRLDRQTPYRRGEPIKVTVRFPDDAPPPPADTQVKVVVERRAPGRAGDIAVRTVQLAKVEASRATYQALLTETPEGQYKCWLSQPTPPNPRPHAECKVLAPPGEMERLQMNQVDLERAADQSHGRFYSLVDAGRLLDELPTGSRITVSAPAPPRLLWSQFPLFLLALTFLTAEWLLRKQKNLL